jgi:hypothetical protein
VNNLYLTLLKRQADPQGLAYYTDRLNNGADHEQIVREIMGGDEYHTDVVQELYHLYLRRDADPTGLSIYVAFLDDGGTERQLRDILISSPEYYNGAGKGTDRGFLDALSQDVLGRPIDSATLAKYPRALGSQSDREIIAGQFLTSTEATNRRVSQLYQLLLQRAADPNGLADYGHQLSQGSAEENVIAALASSDEFFAEPLRTV